MAESQKVTLIGPDGATLVEFLIDDEEEGWFTGKVVGGSFPPEVEKALAWYDEVVEGQMLSYLDDAVAEVRRFGLQVKFPDGSIHNTYSLHVNPSNEVSFRISPVLPPPELPTVAGRAP